jgi:hypothetical protein
VHLTGAAATAAIAAAVAVVLAGTTAIRAAAGVAAEALGRIEFLLASREDEGDSAVPTGQISVSIHSISSKVWSANLELEHPKPGGSIALVTMVACVL